MTIGIIFVHPNYRGIGLGLELFERVINNQRFKNINWGLDSDPVMTQKYASKYGYDKYTNWRINDFKVSIEDMDLDELVKEKEVTIVDVRDVDMEKIIQYDFYIQEKRVRRDGVIKSLLQRSTSFNKVALDRNGDIVGYGNIREGLNRQLLTGPIYAESSEIGSTLLREILESIPNLKSKYTYLWIFPPDTNDRAIEFIKKLSRGKAINFDVWQGQFTISAIQVGLNLNFHFKSIKFQTQYSKIFSTIG